MKSLIIFYLILNCLTLGYVRLRDTKKIDKVGLIAKSVFIVYIGLLALPLVILNWILSKFRKKNEIIK